MEAAVCSDQLDYLHCPGRLVEVIKDFLSVSGGGRSIKRSMKFLFRLPKLYNSNEKFPLVIFLHGSSARGDDLSGLKGFALPKLLVSESFIADLSMIVVCPLCPNKTEWKDPSMCATVMELLDYICSAVSNIDRSRVYCTGVSMGGLGTWMLAARYPDRFAALAPICGGGHPVYARLLSQIPIHFFHSVDDNVVGVEETDRLVEALRRECPIEVLYTRFDFSPEPAAQSWMIGHNCWDKAYSTPAFWDWLLSKNLTTAALGKEA